MARDRVETRSVVVRVVLALLACLAVLGSGAAAGAAELPRPLTSPSGVSASAPLSARTAMDAPGPVALVRTAGVALVPPPAGPGAGLLPGHGPLVAPHLVAEPQSRPPTVRPAASSLRTPGSRAPPALAGT